MGLVAIRPGAQHQPACPWVSYDPGEPAPEELTVDSTGGCLEIFFSEASGELRELSFIRSMLAEVLESKPGEPHFRNMLETIGRIMGLNKSQLAEACGLRTRKTLYSWATGAVPRKKSTQRIHLLYRAALDWRRSGFLHPEKVLNLPVLQGKSLLDLLREDPLDLEAIHFAGARLRMGLEGATGMVSNDPFAD